MAVSLATLTILATLAILPGWLWFRRCNIQSAWLLALPIFGIGLWLTLVATGFGAQSLANLIEVPVVAVVAAIAAYTKFLIFDRSTVLHSRGTFITFAVVAVVTFGLRLFMSALPE